VSRRSDGLAVGHVSIAYPQDPGGPGQFEADLRLRIGDSHAGFVDDVIFNLRDILRIGRQLGPVNVQHDPIGSSRGPKLEFAYLLAASSCDGFQHALGKRELPGQDSILGIA